MNLLVVVSGDKSPYKIATKILKELFKNKKDKVTVCVVDTVKTSGEDCNKPIFDFLKKNMSSTKEAIIKTGAQRLRPVLLTTFTTVLGLLPMVTMTNVDFFTRQIKIGTQDTQWWVQLSTAIVFGLIFATMLTLIVTPSLLMLRENLILWYQKKINS